MHSGRPAASSTRARSLRLRIGPSPENVQSYCFSQAFLIGRDDACEVRIAHDFVSRRHAEVVLENGAWWIRDLNSANGLFVDRDRISAAPVAGALTVRLGLGGPFVWLEEELPPAAPEPLVSPDLEAEAAQRYFGDTVEGPPLSDRTIAIRRTYQKIQKEQKGKYTRILIVLALLLVTCLAYVVVQQRLWNQRQALALELFYAMKNTELDIARLERVLRDTENPQGSELMRSYRERVNQNTRKYEEFLAASKLQSRNLTEEDKLLLRITRVFGECELTMPPDYVREVKKYIGYWKAGNRLKRGITLARENGYAARISRELLAEGLPPQYLYLALQESGLDPYAVGPPTYKGFAKGMWQFIPETGSKYGLRIGPLSDLPRPDPADERHDWEKATRAAARYLKDLYTTDAQASGLLVMACYNWGEDKVLPLVRSMPSNPNQRNFWRLLRDYRDRLPKETYDYVFYIVAATVIGENPRLFGFDFEAPLGHLESF